MRVGFWLSDYGGSPLQYCLEFGLRQLGHEVLDWHPHGAYDVVLVFNQTAHVNYYRYPESFPRQGTPIAFVDTAEYGYFKRLPGVSHLYANTFTEAALAHDTKNRAEQLRLRRWLEGRSFPYLLREHTVYVEYPPCYHPIDYPLYHLTGCGPEPDREEYLRRDLELFVSWGASHPWRRQLTAELRAQHTRCEVGLVGEDGYEKLPQQLYLQRTQAARCSPSYDGYGSGSFRVTEVLARTVLLQGPLSIRTREPLVDGETCVGYDVHSEGETYLGSTVGERLRWVLDHPEEAFEVYRRGYWHCRERLTVEPTARYVLDTVTNHDWSRPTPLDL